jgi:hypothetical protein
MNAARFRRIIFIRFSFTVGVQNNLVKNSEKGLPR